MAPVGAHALLFSDVFGRPAMDPGACSTGVFEVDARNAAALSRIGGLRVSGWAAGGQDCVRGAAQQPRDGAVTASGG
jgi:hypothetical protein